MAGGYGAFMRGLASDTIGSVYLFTGTEDFLKREALGKLCRTLLTPEGRSLNYESFLASEAAWENVETACRTSPLFAERRLVALLCVEQFAEANLARLVAYAKKPSDGSCLVILSSGSGDDARARRAASTVMRLSAALSAHAQVFVFWQGNERDTKAWAEDWLRSNGKRMARGLLEEIVGEAGDSCYEVWNTLEKAAGFVRDRSEITRADVDSVGGAASVGSVDKFKMAVARGDALEAHRNAARCLEGGTEPMRLVWILNKSLRDGLRAGTAAEMEGLRRKERLVAQALRGRLSPERLAAGLAVLHHVERDMKTGVVKAELGLQVVINELTGRLM
ncbi:MAG: DNA polymerase III subunit delta [Candidatus Eisenbacteria bacterium]